MTARTLGNLIGLGCLAAAGGLMICGATMIVALPPVHTLAEMTARHWIAVATITAGCLGMLPPVLVIR